MTAADVVAVGAPSQAGVLGGEVKDIVLLDVTPLSLGVETQGGIFDKLIERNTTIPTKKSRIYTTAQDNQPEVEIHILQGERPLARDNKSLGRFHLSGIPPAPARVPQVEVTFDIDANGILHVTAQDKATNNQQRITITGSGNLNRDEIDRMMKEAEINAESDRQAQELAELKNKSDQLCYSVEKTIRDMGEKLSEADRTRIEGLVADLRKAVAAEIEDDMRQAFSMLEAESHQLAEQLYKDASAQSGTEEEGIAKEPAGTGARSNNSDGDVIDAEFKEEN